MFATLFVLFAGCAFHNYDGATGKIHSVGAFGPNGTVMMAEEANRRAAMVRCDKVLTALQAGELNQYAVVQCGDPYGGVYVGPPNGLWSAYPSYYTPAQQLAASYSDALWQAQTQPSVVVLPADAQLQTTVDWLVQQVAIQPAEPSE